MAYFNAHARTCLISTSGLKSDVIIVFLDPDSLYVAEIPVCTDFQDLLAENGGFFLAGGGRIEEGVVRC